MISTYLQVKHMIVVYFKLMNFMTVYRVSEQMNKYLADILMMWMMLHMDG